MSHSLRTINLGNSALVEVTIIDYVQGGESFTLAELGLTGGVVSALFLTPPNSAYVPVLSGGKVILNRSTNSGFTWQIGTEQPSQAGVNFTFVAIIHGT
jgi:hypothetical protein